MTPELILVLSLALIIGLAELKERKEDKKMQEIREMHLRHTQNTKAELIDMKLTVSSAVKEIADQMKTILTNQSVDSKEARELIAETRAKIAHMHQNFELKTRLADEHLNSQSFDTLEM